MGDASKRLLAGSEIVEVSYTESLPFHFLTTNRKLALRFRALNSVSTEIPVQM